MKFPLYVLRAGLEVASALLTMPLFADLPAGSPHERHRHGAAYDADLFSVRGLAVWTDDMRMAFFIHFATAAWRVMDSLKFFFLFLAFTFETPGSSLFTKIILIPMNKVSIVPRVCLRCLCVYIFCPIRPSFYEFLDLIFIFFCMFRIIFLISDQPYRHRLRIYKNPLLLLAMDLLSNNRTLDAIYKAFSLLAESFSFSKKLNSPDTALFIFSKGTSYFISPNFTVFTSDTFVSFDH